MRAVYSHRQTKTLPIIPISVNVIYHNRKGVITILLHFCNANAGWGYSGSLSS
jgi:hypothetical protein